MVRRLVVWLYVLFVLGVFGAGWMLGGERSAVAASSAATVMHVSQAVPVMVNGKTITVTVGLDVSVSGVSETVRALPSTPVVVVGNGKKMVDALGNEYVVEGDPDVAVEEWTAYEDDGYLSIVGSVRNTATGKRFSAVVADFRFYDAKGKLVDATNDGIGGGWIDPGESYPFTMKRVGEIGAFAWYEVRLQVRDWTEK